MDDQSFLDEQYFVSDTVYNCPFCNRRHVTYSIQNVFTFDWTPDKECIAYFVRCNSCRNRSMHLSYENFYYKNNVGGIKFDIGAYRKLGGIDNGMFYSVPTSFFVLDKRIPRILREIFAEAEGSLKSNFLTGASACARKIVYELARLNGVTDGNYDEQIKSLKVKHPEVDGTYFDTLLTIQKTTSSKVHENAYDGWEAKHVRLILSALSEILHELYVVPALRDDRRQGILALQKELLGSNAPPAEGGPDADADSTAEDLP